MTQAIDFPFVSMPEIGSLFLTRLNAIREADPVFWSDHQHGWLITRHADIIDGFMQKYPLSSRKFGTATLATIPESERHDPAIPNCGRPGSPRRTSPGTASKFGPAISST